MSKPITVVIVLAIVAIAGIFIFTDADIGGEEGSIVFAVTDEAADMENISEVEMTVEGVDLRTESGTWIRTSSETRAFNLLELNESERLELLDETTATPGTYEGIRLHVAGVVVTTNDGNETNAALANDEVVIEGQVTVSAAGEINGEATTSDEVDMQENETSAVVVFDVQADESLHVTADGEYVFAPVVELSAQTGATVEISTPSEEENATVVLGEEGSTTATVLVGVDADGESRMNFTLDTSEGIEITADGSLELLGTGTTATDTQEQMGDENNEDQNVETEVNVNGEVDVETGVDGDTTTSGEAETEVEVEGGIY